MSGFAALMALSASQTKQVQSAVQTALEQRQRNEELKRKKREEDERKAREEEAKLRQKRFEDQKKQQELDAKREVEQARREAEQLRREEEARQALLYGPKKAKQQQGTRWPMSQSEVRKRAEEERSESPMALTREEKRQRRVEAEMKRTYQLKRSALTGYAKAGRRLPGGAIDAPSSTAASDSGGSSQSVKARLAALPNTLTKLNVNKRDTRTIDEILQDRAKAKNVVLDGDDAREFNDWFGKSKKKETVPFPSTSGSSSGGESPMRSGTKTPLQALVKSQTPAKTATKPSRPMLTTKSSSSTIPKVKPCPVPRVQSGRTVGVPPLPPPPPPPPPRPGKLSPKKRPRSSSLSSSPPPSKRRASEPDSSLSHEIWKLFGKDRSTYISRDVLSDDEDMEADASAMMKEEMRSARLAKREDEMALEEEKRHEEEKRRRKRERQGI